MKTVQDKIWNLLNLVSHTEHCNNVGEQCNNKLK